MDHGVYVKQMPVLNYRQKHHIWNNICS